VRRKAVINSRSEFTTFDAECTCRKFQVVSLCLVTLISSEYREWLFVLWGAPLQIDIKLK